MTRLATNPRWFLMALAALSLLVTLPTARAATIAYSMTLCEDLGVMLQPNNQILAIECKSSNSEINSRKRLNKEVVKNANGWTSNFGKLVIAGAVLRGVFKPQYDISAQETPVAIFWGHRLSDLAAFIRAART